MRVEHMLKQLGQQLCIALNETSEDARMEHKYNLLEQIEGLIKMAACRDEMLLNTAALLDNANKNCDAKEYTAAMRNMVFIKE
ncbi:hypothetical protein [Aeromonas allosaccharophila]|uniref:hypothetical protein n=1 Tax=Aeromonas allosaccharophila TaxID=656 RepID=UPI0036D9F0A7